MPAFTVPFESPSGSPIRELFKYLSEPGMISLAGGYPASDAFDMRGLHAAAAQAWATPTRCLQYGPTDGLPELKHEVACVMRRRGVSVSPEQMMITTGSQQGFDLLLRVFVNPGDIVLTEQPTYPATLQALRQHQARVITIPVDAEGINVARIAAILESGEFSKPKLLYTVPTFANPTGATLSHERRVALIALAVKHDFLIAEDDPYGELRFSGAPLPPIRALAESVDFGSHHVVYLGSLSKIVAPGLRVGWLLAASEIVDRCVVAKQAADLCSAPWTQAIAAAYLAEGSLVHHLPRIRSMYQLKCRTLCEELKARLDGVVRFQPPEGGMFVWARAECVESSELLRYAIAQKVLFVPAAGFFSDSVDPWALRLAFAAPPHEDIREAVARLALAFQVVREKNRAVRSQRTELQNGALRNHET